MTRYEQRRREIAKREFERYKAAGRISYVQSFDSWYGNSFLNDALLMALVVEELGPEESYSEPETSYPDEDNSTDSYDDSSSSDSSESYSE